MQTEASVPVEVQSPDPLGNQSSLLNTKTAVRNGPPVTAQHMVNVHVACLGKAVRMEDLLARVMPLSRTGVSCETAKTWCKRNQSSWTKTSSHLRS